MGQGLGGMRGGSTQGEEWWQGCYCILYPLLSRRYQRGSLQFCTHLVAGTDPNRPIRVTRTTQGKSDTVPLPEESPAAFLTPQDSVAAILVPSHWGRLGLGF